MDKQQTKRAKKKRSGEKTIRFRCDYSSTPLKVLESRGWTRVFDPKDRRWDLWWCDTSEIKAALDCNFQRLRAQQRVAHFLNHGELTRKNLLYRNLRRYKRTLLKAGKSREAALCDIMPVSFELPSEYRMLVEEYRRSQGATWIVKPAAGSQGRGIFLFQRLRDLAEWRSREYPPPSQDCASEPECPPPPDIYIVQKYIDNPYLLGGCKFDMRIYVLVTSFQPLKVWLAREGFARLSGEQFSLERIDDSRVHLTNMSIQLKAAAGRPPSPRPDCDSARPPAKLGSKWPLSCLRQYLTERHGAALVDDLLHNIAGAYAAIANVPPRSAPFEFRERPASALPTARPARQVSTSRREIRIRIWQLPAEITFACSCECSSVYRWLPTLFSEMDVLVCYNEKKIRMPVNDKGNLFLSSLKTHFPSANGLTYEDEEGEIQSLAVNADEIMLNSKVTEYFAHCSNEVTSHVEKVSALGNDEEGCNKENELNGTNGVNEECSEEKESNVQRPRDNDAIERHVKVQGVTKTLRIGWLNKAAGATKYRRVARPRGGVKRLKLDASAFYSAHQIKLMAAEAFEASSGGDKRAILDEYSVSLGDFSGREIGEFRRRDGRLCDIWEYCRDRGKRLYQLSLFMLTSPLHEDEDEPTARPIERTISTRRTKARPRIVNDVRVFYQYTRRSSYSNELSYAEYERPELHRRLLEERFGEGPPLERFEPPDHGYAIRRVERAGQLLLEISVDDDAAVQSIEFPACAGLEEHAIARDADRLQGYCDGGFGLGFLPSCGSACRPLFSWYRDGELFKRAEYLYWLNNVKDERPHRWMCTVECRATDRQLRSKEVLIGGLED